MSDLLERPQTQHVEQRTTQLLSLFSSKKLYGDVIKGGHVQLPLSFIRSSRETKSSNTSDVFFKNHEALSDRSQISGYATKIKPVSLFPLIFL